MSTVLPVVITNKFHIGQGKKNQIKFESQTGKTTIIDDLIENLEIIIA
ncbi:hypothetical protein [Zooshikella sp. RANM57]